jgi:hypothetical protein
MSIPKAESASVRPADAWRHDGRIMALVLATAGVLILDRLLTGPPRGSAVALVLGLRTDGCPPFPRNRGGDRSKVADRRVPPEPAGPSDEGERRPPGMLFTRVWCGPLPGGDGGRCDSAL